MSPYTQIRISRKTHEFLKRECVELGTPSMTDFIEFLVEVYKENREVFDELTGGIIGKAKPNLFDSKDVKTFMEINKQNND